MYCLFPAPDEAQLSRWYDAEYYGEPSRKFVEPIANGVARFQRARAQRVSRAIPAGARILDIGCGNGGFLAAMKRRGYEVEGTERTEGSADRAASGPGLTVHVGDLLELSLPERSFDALTMWHVFEHLRHPLETLERAHLLLKDTGTLFLSLPNHESWQARFFGTAWFHLDPPRHLFGFGPQSLTDILESSGFEVTRTSTFSLEQNPYGFMQSVLNRVGFPRDRAYRMLKGTGSLPLGAKLLDLLLLALLLAPGITLSSLASFCGTGATMEVQARKRPSGR